MTKPKISLTKGKPAIVGAMRGLVAGAATAALGAIVIELQNGRFDLKEIAVPIVIAAIRAVEGLLDQKATTPA